MLVPVASEEGNTRTSAHAVADGSRPRPSAAGSLGYLLLNLPLGIAGFVAVVTLASVGMGTVIVWAGGFRCWRR